MRRIESTEFIEIKKSLFNKYKDKKCPVNRYFYYCGDKSPNQVYQNFNPMTDLKIADNSQVLIWSFGSDYFLEVESHYIAEFLNIVRFWEYEALKMKVLLIFPKSMEWLIAFSDEELNYKVFKFY